jgi:hypothetical protein
VGQWLEESSPCQLKYRILNPAYSLLNSGISNSVLKTRLKRHLIAMQSQSVARDDAWLPCNHKIFSDINFWLCVFDDLLIGGCLQLVYGRVCWRALERKWLVCIVCIVFDARARNYVVRNLNMIKLSTIARATDIDLSPGGETSPSPHHHPLI